MTEEVFTFLLGLALTVAACLAVVLYLKPHLQRILLDLCGTQERAAFWTAFSNITLFLVPVIFAMHLRPQPGKELSSFFQVSQQLKFALIGLVSAVIILGWVISRFLPSRAWAALPPLEPPQSK
jgi:hypothetical protein